MPSPCVSPRGSAARIPSMRDIEDHSQSLPFPDLALFSVCATLGIPALRLCFSFLPYRCPCRPPRARQCFALPLLPSQSKAVFCLRISLHCLAYHRHAEPCYAMPLPCMAALFHSNHLPFTSFPYTPTLCLCLSRPSMPLRSYASPAWRICRGVSQITPLRCKALQSDSHAVSCAAYLCRYRAARAGHCFAPRDTQLFISEQSPRVSYPCKTTASPVHRIISFALLCLALPSHLWSRLSNQFPRAPMQCFSHAIQF